MDATLPAEQDELEALERERARIEAQLRAPASATIEALLLEERRWVVRRSRALERVPVSSRAVLVAGRAVRCQVRDVSSHGASVELDAEVRVGQQVRLVLAELEHAPALDAVVRHVTGRRLGLEFVPRGELARAVAAELVRRFRQPGA